MTRKKTDNQEPALVPGSKNLLERWDISIEDLTEVVDANPSLRGMMLGYLAEVKLRNMWFAGPPVSEVHKYDDHDRKRKGDLVITYKGSHLIIECKSLQTNTIKRVEQKFTALAQVDASDRRIIKLPDGSTVNTTCLLVGEFDLLAVNLFACEECWRFVFAKNEDLPRSTFSKYSESQRKYLLSSLVKVTWPPEPPFYDEPFALLDEIAGERKR